MRVIKKLLVILTIILILSGCHNNETEVTLNSTEIFVYSDEQLTETAESVDTKDKLIEQYPTAYTRTVSMVQNDISNAIPTVEVCYRGATKVLRLMFDGISGSKISSHFYNTCCSKNEFDTLAIGQSLLDVQTIDPGGEFNFLYTGRNDVPKVSTHYTTDGFVIIITYDSNNMIKKIDIVPM